MFIATIRSRELTTITPLAGVAVVGVAVVGVVVVGAAVVGVVVPTTSGRSQHERGGFSGLQMSVAR